MAPGKEKQFSDKKCPLCGERTLNETSDTVGSVTVIQYSCDNCGYSVTDP